MGLYRRGQVWWMVFTHKGKHYRKSTETTNPKLAQRVYDKIKGQIAEGKWFEVQEEKTFGEMMDRYLIEHVSKKKSKRSYEGYVRNLRTFFEDYKLSEITADLILKYREKRAEGGVKPATVNRDLAIMKNAFNRATYKWEPSWATVNPVKKVEMLAENNERDRWLSKEEVDRLKAACPGWLWEICLFAIHTGLRQGELLSLRWPMVDMARKVIVIPRPFTKNKEPKTVPLNDYAMKVLKKRPRSIKTDLVFYTSNHSQYRGRNVDRSFSIALAKAGIKDFRFHDLRHTCATWLLHSGADIYEVQKILGHKNGEITKRYAHHSAETLRGAMINLAKEFGKKGTANVKRAANYAGR